MTATATEAPLESIVIVGGGTAGWLTAAALGAALAPQRVRVVLVEAPVDPDDADSGAAVFTLPEARALHRRIGLQERALLRSASATFKLGVMLDGWSGAGRAAFIPHGPVGEGPSFHQYWLRAGAQDAFADYSAAAVAAKQMKFAPQIPGGPPLSFGLHLDAHGYAAALGTLATGHAVVRANGAVRDLRRRDDGCIEAVVLDSGDAIEGDFFVDCTGAEALLIGGALGATFEDWSEVLPCASALVAQTSAGETVPPFTRAKALSAGWLQTIPLQDRIEHAYFYSDRHISEGDAARELAEACGSREVAAKPLRLRNGMRQDAWRANCVAIGAAAAVLEPLHGASLHVAHRGVARLLSMLPRKSCAGGEREEYNRLMRSETMRMRDFLIMHYAGADRPEPFWRERREAKEPEELARKRELFASRGRVPLCDEETFLEQDWAALFIALGIRPERLDVRAGGADPEGIRKGLARMRERISRAVAAMPSHKDFITAALMQDARRPP